MCAANPNRIKLNQFLCRRADDRQPVTINSCWGCPEIPRGCKEFRTELRRLTKCDETAAPTGAGKGDVKAPPPIAAGHSEYKLIRGRLKLVPRKDPNKIVPPRGRGSCG
jgi:hypothetical protein